MGRTNLFDLLGKPVADNSSDLGTVETFTRETFDDDTLLPSIIDCGTIDTRAVETFDDDDTLLTLL